MDRKNKGHLMWKRRAVDFVSATKNTIAQKLGEIMEIFEIVKIFDGICSHNNGNDVGKTHFRLEVLQALDKQFYMGKIYRIEANRLQPVFPQSQGVLPDCENDAFIFVADSTFNYFQLIGTSVEEVMAKFESELQKVFG